MKQIFSIFQTCQYKQVHRSPYLFRCLQQIVPRAGGLALTWHDNGNIWQQDSCLVSWCARVCDIGKLCARCVSMNCHTTAGSHHFLWKVVITVTYDFFFIWSPTSCLNAKQQTALSCICLNTQPWTHTHTVNPSQSTIPDCLSPYWLLVWNHVCGFCRPSCWPGLLLLLIIIVSIITVDYRIHDSIHGANLTWDMISSSWMK